MTTLIAASCRAARDSPIETPPLAFETSKLVRAESLLRRGFNLKTPFDSEEQSLAQLVAETLEDDEKANLREQDSYRIRFAQGKSVGSHFGLVFRSGLFSRGDAHSYFTLTILPVSKQAFAFRFFGYSTSPNVRDCELIGFATLTPSGELLGRSTDREIQVQGKIGTNGNQISVEVTDEKYTDYNPGCGVGLSLDGSYFSTSR